MTALAAQAHDTWFEARPADGGRVQLALGTGNQFPIQETPIGAEYLVAQGCAVGTRAPVRMKPLQTDEHALLLAPPRGALSCWVQSQPFDVTVPPDKVELYLREIRASDAVRQRWAGLQQQGLPWRERYVKHARIDLAAQPAPAPDRALGMDLLRLPGLGTPQTGGHVAAQVLRDGQPLADQPIEARHEASALGIWRRSDAQGRVDFPLPLPGRWVLRGVDLRASPDDPQAWVSRFVTLAFDAAAPAAADQNGSSLTSATRSNSQIAATPAISSDPPISTTRR